jgi:arginine:pyruvate transaminase
MGDSTQPAYFAAAQYQAPSPRRFASAATGYGTLGYAAFALTNDEEYINGVREEYRQRRNYVCERVAAISGISCHVPKAGMFVMIKVDEVAGDGLAFAEALLAEQGVSTLPGVGFGDCTANYVRVSLAQPINVLRPAFDRMQAFCESRISG